MTRHDPALYPTARLRANVALPFGQAIAMPKPVCTSAGFAALDQRHIFARDRLCAGRADVLRAPGGHLTMEIPGKPILVTRDRGGHVPAMSKVCRHRVSTLPEGRGTTRTTVCPRHGSTYNLDGTLHAAPAMTRNDGFCKDRIALPPVRCKVWRGRIMVTLIPDAPPVANRLASVSDLIGPFQMEANVKSPREEFRWATNRKVPAENVMESCHLPVCHAASIGGHGDLPAMPCHKGLPVFNHHSILKTDAPDLALAPPANTRPQGNRQRTAWLLSVCPSLRITLSPGHFRHLSLPSGAPGIGRPFRPPQGPAGQGERQRQGLCRTGLPGPLRRSGRPRPAQPSGAARLRFCPLHRRNDPLTRDALPGS